MKSQKVGNQQRIFAWLFSLLLLFYGTFTILFLPAKALNSAFTEITFLIEESRSYSNENEDTIETDRKNNILYKNSNTISTPMVNFLESFGSTLEGIPNLLHYRSYSLNQKHIFTLLLETKQKNLFWQSFTNLLSLELEDNTKDAIKYVSLTMPKNSLIKDIRIWKTPPIYFGMFYKMRNDDISSTFERSFYRTVKFAQTNGIFDGELGDFSPNSVVDSSKPSIKILIDPKMMEHFGLNISDVTSSISTKLGKLPQLPLRVGQKLLAGGWSRTSMPGQVVADLMSHMVEKKDGQEVGLSKFAKISWKNDTSRTTATSRLKNLEEQRNQEMNTFWWKYWSSFEKTLLFGHLILAALLATVVSRWHLQQEIALIFSLVFGLFVFLPILPIHANSELILIFSSILIGTWGIVRYLPKRLFPRFFFLPPVFAIGIFFLGILVSLVTIFASHNQFSEIFSHSESAYSFEKKNADFNKNFGLAKSDSNVILDVQSNQVFHNKQQESEIKVLHFQDFKIDIQKEEITDVARILPSLSLSKGAHAAINNLPEIFGGTYAGEDLLWILFIFSCLVIIFFLYLKVRAIFFCIAACYVSTMVLFMSGFFKLLLSQVRLTYTYENFDQIIFFVPATLVISFSAFCSFCIRQEEMRKNGRDPYRASLMLAKCYERICFVLLFLIGITWPVTLLQEPKKTTIFCIMCLSFFMVFIPSFMSKFFAAIDEEFTFWKLFLKVRIKKLIFSNEASFNAKG